MKSFHLISRFTNIYFGIYRYGQEFVFIIHYSYHCFQVDVIQSKTLRPNYNVGRFESRISQIPFNEKLEHNNGTIPDLPAK